MIGWACGAGTAASVQSVSAAARSEQARASARGAPRSRLRALCSLDITVPIGQLSTSAISRYESPSTSLSMIMVRALGGKVSSARRMRSRCSAPSAAWSGPRPGSGVRALPLLLGHPLRCRRRAPARPRCAVPVGGHVHGDAEEPGVERRLAAERRQRLKRPHERLLSARPTPPRGRAAPGRPDATPAAGTSRPAARTPRRLRRCTAR